VEFLLGECRPAHTMRTNQKLWPIQLIRSMGQSPDPPTWDCTRRNEANEVGQSKPNRSTSSCGGHLEHRLEWEGGTTPQWRPRSSALYLSEMEKLMDEYGSTMGAFSGTSVTVLSTLRVSFDLQAKAYSAVREFVERAAIGGRFGGITIGRSTETDNRADVTSKCSGLN